VGNLAQPTKRTGLIDLLSFSSSASSRSEKERKKEEDSLFLSANKLVSFDHPQPSLVVVAKLKAQK
jgi:hypothetical protein